MARKKKIVGLLSFAISFTACVVGVLAVGTACEGAVGPQGERGVGIVSVQKIEEYGYTDTYKIFFSDGTSTTFTVTNGQDGQQGEQGIQGEDGATWTYGEGAPTATARNGDFYLDSKTTDVYVYINEAWSKVCCLKGVQGDKGDQGLQGEKGDKGDNAVHANEKHTVTYSLEGGELPDGALSSVTVDYGDTLELPVPTRENYTFEGWYTGNGVNDGKFTSVTPVTKTLTLTARWKANISYLLSYETNGGNAISSTLHYFDETIETLCEPVKYDCEFVGWYQDESLSTPVGYPLTLTKNQTVYAKWTTAYYYVNFHTNCENTIEPQNVPAGTSFTAFSAPENETFKFAGWYFDSGFTKAVEYPFEIHSNTDLFAKWEDVYYTFSFVSNGGSQIAAQKYREGVGIDSLPTPTRKNYRFDGWFEDFDLTVPVSFPYEISEAKTLYAKWTWVDPYANYKKISSVSDFLNIGNNLSGKYVLTKDIDFQNQTISPIGSPSVFAGVLDGNGYSISNIVMSSSSGDCALFIWNNGTITNLSIENASVTGKATNTSWFGVVCAENNGTISKVSVNGIVAVYGDSSSARIYGFRAGLISATNNGQINNCSIAGNVTACAYNSQVAYIGGVAGYSAGKIYDCFSSATLKDSANDKSSRIGGIVSINAGEIQNSVFVGSVHASSSATNIGAISGTKETTATETKCYAYTNVSGGTSTSITNLDTASFYTSTLGWSSEIWDFSTLDFQNGLYVKLK